MRIFRERGITKGLLFLVVLWINPPSVLAAEWHVAVGVQSRDKGSQVLAFLPNELWVHAGDSITWHFFTDEIHTVSFLQSGQIRPTYVAGCPGVGTTPDGSSFFTGMVCVNSGTLVTGQSYTVNFPSAGNFRLVCLVHANMTGTIHVLPATEVLPHDQDFYNREAEHEANELLADGSRLEARGIEAAVLSSVGPDHHSQHQHGEIAMAIIAGISEVVATSGGGSHSVSVMRFMRDTIVVHVGDTVEWTNFGPVVQHTVTFGQEPADPAPFSAGVFLDPDGARHAFINSPNDNVHSGYLTPERQERPGLAQPAPVQIRFRATFTQPGTFKYICTLHDELGMVGQVIVVP